MHEDADVTLKQRAAKQALEYLQDGMSLGLGSGSTMEQFLLLLAERVRNGELRHISGVPTSSHIAQLAEDLGIPRTTLEAHPVLDLAIDGADEVDGNLNLIKGLGKALLREKVVAVHARRLVILVDESKYVPRLGMTKPLPVELLPFEAQAHVRWLNTLGCKAELWLDEQGRPYVTDNGNFLARCWFPGGISDPEALARQLAERPGIIEHGLFLEMADEVIIASDAEVKILRRKR